ncbi:peptidase S16 [Pacificimonas flava]|uniref:Peptidase S16 n=2 Tax=Pacificimonas TaxID=1960290 RepID=A0A219B3P3_9SPHN|nr:MULTISPECIES: LON peptidase substrate-binding domain-containing protein [Pacificimonas]MBZ6377551.1 LON peptidase substrate-binding domain-containing protein [Pacificimonas aurantium]OWV32756.1 peptidase S16 [Pacificimonas flava]
MSDLRLDTLPPAIPIFPLEGAVVLPRGNLPLNIFEPRYLDMVRDAVEGPGLIGMVQPREDGELYEVGGLGRIESCEETPDGRYEIILAGLMRFRIAEELTVMTSYRQVSAHYREFLGDLRTPTPLDATTRAALEQGLKLYLDEQGLSADWDAVTRSDDETMVNTLAAVCPFDPAEKQALVEAEDLPRRAALLEALMRFPGGDDAAGGRQVH